MKWMKIVNVLFIVLIAIGNPATLFAQTDAADTVDDPLGDRTSISYSSEEYFAEEYQRANKASRTGFALFWAGVGLTTISGLVGTVISSLDESQIDQGTSDLISLSSFATVGLSSILTIAGATAWWNGSHRILSLVEVRKEFFTSR